MRAPAHPIRPPNPSVGSTRAVLVAALLAAACGGSPDDDDGAPDGTDDPTDTPLTETTEPTGGDTGPTDATDLPAPTSTLDASGPIACADPDAARRDGLYERRLLTWDEPEVKYLEGTGSGVADFDGDGHVDFVVVLRDRVVAFWQTPKGGFTRADLLVDTPADDVSGLFGASVVDHDDDGDLDLMITGRASGNHLLRNDGGRAFTDVTADAGLGVVPARHHTTGSSWSDVDGDGDLDLFLGGHGWVDEEASVETFGPADPSWLFLNDGDGTFTDASTALPADVQDGYTFMGGWFDADDDGDDDLYMVNDFGAQLEPCRLLLNDGGTFTKAGETFAVDAALAGMGFGVGDFDGDGEEDFAVPAWRRNALYLRGGGAFYESARSVGFWPDVDADQYVAWGTEFVDANNDGRTDILTVFGHLDTNFGSSNPEAQPDAMYLQGDDGQLADRADVGDMADRAPHRGVGVADLNRDGWLDYVKTGLDGTGRLYLSRCGEEAWLTVDLHQPAPNTHAVGAWVRAWAGDRVWVRRVRAGGTGFSNGNPPELHFGFGDVDQLDRLEVTWPDGHVETWTGLQTRQRLTIRR